MAAGSAFVLFKRVAIRLDGPQEHENRKAAPKALAQADCQAGEDCEVLRGTVTTDCFV